MLNSAQPPEPGGTLGIAAEPPSPALGRGGHSQVLPSLFALSLGAGVSRLSPECPRCHWGGSRTPILPTEEIPSAAPALGTGCPADGRLLSCGENGGSARTVPLPSAHAGARRCPGPAGGAGGSCSRRDGRGWTPLAPLLPRLGVQPKDCGSYWQSRGEERALCAGTSGTSGGGVGGRVCVRCPVQPRSPLSTHGPGADIFSRRFQVMTAGRKSWQAT